MFSVCTQVRKNEEGRYREGKTHLPNSSSGHTTHNTHTYPPCLFWISPESPEHRSAPRSCSLWWSDHPFISKIIPLRAWKMVTRRLYTHREDHLQVVEHLDLFREALAAPSHQVVLTVGRGVAPLLPGAQHCFGKYIHWASTMCLTSAGCWEYSETEVVPPSKRSQSYLTETGAKNQ